MSLIDEALRRAQAERRAADADGRSPGDPWQGAPLPDARRGRRRVRVAAAVGVAAVLLIAGGALVLTRRGGGREAPRIASSKNARMEDQPPPASGPIAAAAQPTPRPERFETVPPSPRSRRFETVPASPARDASSPMQPTAIRIVSAPSASERAPAARSSDAPARTATTRREPIPPSRPASSSPRIAAPIATAPVPITRPHVTAPGDAAERGRAVHVGEVGVPGGHIELGGIVYSDANPVALLNGRIVGVGGTVEGFTVVSIQESQVELKNDHRTIFLRLR
jgi:hypothetical protein